MRPQPHDPMAALQRALTGRYVLHSELGRGGMGIVYLAHDVALQRWVALKLLPPQATATHWRERLIREARIAARLSHPHIVAIHSAEQVEDFVFFTMAFVDGETLGDRIRAEGALPVGEVTRILHEVAEAVRYAHGRGVIHRDLKPDNIILEAGTGRALVLDFGIAQLGADPEAGTGVVRGTLAFLSPERASGQSADARSDIYALGVTAYYAATGRVPFQAANADELVLAHARRDMAPLEARGQDGDDTLAKVVATCLAAHPADRYQSAEDLVAALAEAPEIQREVPVPLQAFVDRSQALARSAAGLSALMALAVLWIAGSIGAGDATGTLWGAAALAVLVGVPVLRILPALRRVLRAGYDRDTIIATLHKDLERRRKVLAYEVGKDAERRGRWGRRIAYGALGVTALAAGWMVSGLPGGLIAVAAFFGSVPVAIIAGLVGHARSRGPRLTMAANLWLTFWRSAVGTWVGHLAGIGVNPDAGADPDALLQVHGIVELMDSQILRLKSFINAPDTVERGLGDLSEWAPGNLQALETMRTRIAELGHGGAVPASLTGDLAAARRVCEMVELMFGAKLAAKDLRVE